MVIETTAMDGLISEDVLKFSQEHGILEYVERAMKAAREVFTDGEGITASLKRDPEFGDLYVDIHVTLRDSEEPEAQRKRTTIVSRNGQRRFRQNRADSSIIPLHGAIEGLCRSHEEANCCVGNSVGLVPRRPRRCRRSRTISET